jgi:hypothetical protein
MGCVLPAFNLFILLLYLLSQPWGSKAAAQSPEALFWTTRQSLGQQFFDGEYPNRCIGSNVPTRADRFGREFTVRICILPCGTGLSADS